MEELLAAELVVVLNEEEIYFSLKVAGDGERIVHLRKAQLVPEI